MANAHLIAAAPEMLAALREIHGCLDCGEDYGQCSKCRTLMSAAIAKAEARP